MWNIPLRILINIKKIIEIETDGKAEFYNYSEYVETLNNLKLSENNEVRRLINESLESLKDKSADYHIMKIENLFETLLDKYEQLNISQKINKIHEIYDFETLRNEYVTNINKRKKLLLESIRYVYVNQTGKLAVFKYSQEVNFYDLWNEFYMESRGLIIDVYKMQLVSCPYRKFFNLNEKEYTTVEKIEEYIDKAISVTIGNKEDGSMIGAPVYEDAWVVHTGGMIESLQSEWAKKYMFEHYKKLVEDKPENLTFLFEAEYPENRIVVDYGNKRMLVLTGIRDNLTGRLLFPEKLGYYANKYKIPMPEKETKSFYELLEVCKDIIRYPADKKEGWVILIQTETEDFQIKLKCDDYCEIHKLINALSAPKIIFNHIVNDTLDDLKSKAPDIILERIEKISAIVFNYIESKHNEIDELLKKIPVEYLFSDEEVKIYNSFIVCVETLKTNINDKLSKIIKNDIEKAFINRAIGKDVLLDRWAMKEFENLWAQIPDNIKDQKKYNTKKNNLIRYSNINAKIYQKAVMDYALKRKYNIYDFLDIKEIVFYPDDEVHEPLI